MPDLSGIRTSIASGSTFNITWFTAFPHHVCAYDPNAPFGRQLRYSFQGGYRIEVLNEKEEPIAVLTSTDGAFVGDNDATYANIDRQHDISIIIHLRFLGGIHKRSRCRQIWSVPTARFASSDKPPNGALSTSSSRAPTSTSSNVGNNKDVLRTI